ncbi:MAG: SpoIIE family protein phosphatase, partial [Ignavibacteriaceae bacterium]|nr:SpoIIE family protein phosphatase [Ignavibacteriaceae bacterium]
MNKLKNFIARNRQKLIMISAIFLLIIGILNIIYVYGVRVKSNDECLWVPKEEGVFFDKVKVNGVTWNAGVRNGDQLISINKEKITSDLQAQKILDKVKGGDFAKYTFKKGSNEIEGKVYVKKLINFSQVGLGLLGLFWLVIGFIVVSAKPEGYLQRLFYNIGACFVLYEVFVFGVEGQTPDWFNALIGLTWTAAATFLPFMLIHFFWIFPKPFNFSKKKWVGKTLFYIPLIMYTAAVLFRILLLILHKDRNNYFQLNSDFLTRLLLGSMIIGLISLFINYIRMKEKGEKKPVFIILSAYTLGLFSILYTVFVAPVITDTMFNSPEYYTPILLVAVIPIAFGISIFRYQLMDVSIVVKNTIIYGVATITIAAVYFFMIYIIGQSVSAAIGTDYQGIIAGVIFIVFAIVFQSTKNKFQDFLTEKFYPEQFAYQKVLIRFSNDVSVIVGMDNILNSMKDTLVESLMIKEFGIMIKNPENELKLERSVGLKHTDLIISESNIDRYIEEKSLISNYIVVEQADFINVFPTASARLIEDNINTIIPMIIKSRVIGLLLFGLKHSGAQFAGKDLELLYAAANQAAISIENARLYRSEADKLKIERDLDLARKIQQSLLPKCNPNLKGLDICGQMVPAMQVGGDYYDLIPISPTKLFVVVGDVSGKGLSASLYMTKLQTMMQLACVANRSPRDILIEINRNLYISMEKDWFVTMTLALFDVEKGIVRVCRAGHAPLLAASNGTVDSYRTQGIGVGLEKGVIFDRTLVEEEIVLSPGKIFAFYSDGITEAINEQEDFFGEEKLAGLLKGKTNMPSTELMDEIWES